MKIEAVGRDGKLLQSSPVCGFQGRTGWERDVIAIVDDDEAMRDSAQLMLKLHGFEVSCFRSGPELLASDPDRFSFILVDHQMPVMSGLDLISRLRQQLITGSIAIMSGSSSPDISLRAFALGASHFFSKPLKENELVLAILSTAAQV